MAAAIYTIAAELPGESAPVRGDPGRLRQVLDNLLGNATKYSPGAARCGCG